MDYLKGLGLGPNSPYLQMMIESLAEDPEAKKVIKKIMTDVDVDTLNRLGLHQLDSWVSPVDDDEDAAGIHPVQEITMSPKTVELKHNVENRIRFQITEDEARVILQSMAWPVMQQKSITKGTVTAALARTENKRTSLITFKREDAAPTLIKLELIDDWTVRAICNGKIGFFTQTHADDEVIHWSGWGEMNSATVPLSNIEFTVTVTDGSGR